MRALLFISALMVGCSSLPPAPPSICDQLEDNDEWLQPLLSARAQYGTPVELSLALLEPPLSDTDKVHVRVRTPDWDEYRVRSENWGADSHSIADAVDFVGWFSRESVARNQIGWQDYRSHYLALRLGHGGLLRFEPEKYPELEQQALAVDSQARLWRQQITQCESDWHKKPWYSRLKVW
ncbi:hypothetical protein [Neptuniibacter sp. CAU 1671]|uniref:transglycosylase SLT domain-containing protein n=1 Tax=Neptuniibacter sp. CAU 1671 TaxID=3032593 RepID=UPI0023D9B66A|nr:hypothetical protein [Neptuniibacter sp. CAU 1671]MDF2181389.1 hypothetical protein [Neptuniibacter sp. CAU 1671]